MRAIERTGVYSKRFPADADTALLSQRWRCFHCTEIVEGDSDELIYFWLFDLVYHRHGETLWRALRCVDEDCSEVQAPQVDPRTGEMSAPAIELAGDIFYLLDRKGQTFSKEKFRK